ncbi:MAG: hypothetical protein HQM14_21545 [SAR324 cluster bacterium]|nr:hypothetical protein [SAR324 cluster bacterium]
MTKYLEKSSPVQQTRTLKKQIWWSRFISVGFVGLLMVLSGCATIGSGNLIDSGAVKLETQNSESVRFTNVRVVKNDDGFMVTGHIGGHGRTTGPSPRGKVSIEVLNSAGQVVAKKIVDFKHRVRDRSNHGPDFGEFSSHIHIVQPEGVTVRLSHLKSHTY